MQEFNPYLVGGATRPDAISGLNPDFSTALWRMIQEAPPDIQAELRLTSGYRSPEIQEKLWSDAVAKYGSEDAAQKWVARPGKSNHNKGGAVDFQFLGDKAKDYVHSVAGKYNLHFPMEWEPWHVEYGGGGSNALASGAPSQGGGMNALAGGRQAPQNALAALREPQVPQVPMMDVTPFLRQNRLGA